ncbi:hypothetical protein [Pedobacter paludis]|uniref:Uncharacterized protein n=1 Tax=Pedobacter paludis TaxID=2203212 RepID=A0A317F0C5_9SPHI|nr:hypothetical protein [Pedobacter paludis]PWS32215.1 hypothetical protein DF947_10625 [Pedobacter paludis]
MEVTKGYFTSGNLMIPHELIVFLQRDVIGDRDVKGKLSRLYGLLTTPGSIENKLAALVKSENDPVLMVNAQFLLENSPRVREGDVAPCMFEEYIYNIIRSLESNRGFKKIAYQESVVEGLNRSRMSTIAFSFRNRICNPGLKELSQYLTDWYNLLREVFLMANHGLCLHFQQIDPIRYQMMEIRLRRRLIAQSSLACPQVYEEGAFTIYYTGIDIFSQIIFGVCSLAIQSDLGVQKARGVGEEYSLTSFYSLANKLDASVRKKALDSFQSLSLISGKCLLEFGPTQLPELLAII